MANGSMRASPCALECCSSPLCLQLNATAYGNQPTRRAGASCSAGVPRGRWGPPRAPRSRAWPHLPFLMSAAGDLPPTTTPAPTTTTTTTKAPPRNVGTTLGQGRLGSCFPTTLRRDSRRGLLLVRARIEEGAGRQLGIPQPLLETPWGACDTGL